MISLQQEEKLKSHLFTPSVANDKGNLEIWQPSIQLREKLKESAAETKVRWSHQFSYVYL